jgi:hypothetical protein
MLLSSSKHQPLLTSNQNPLLTSPAACTTTPVLPVESEGDAAKYSQWSAKGQPLYISRDTSTEFGGPVVGTSGAGTGFEVNESGFRLEKVGGGGAGAGGGGGNGGAMLVLSWVTDGSVGTW